jgi:hypothetical protein
VAHGEAGDDHQYELAEELGRRGLAVHRSCDAITAEDLLATRHTGVRRLAAAPRFALSPDGDAS